MRVRSPLVPILSLIAIGAGLRVLRHFGVLEWPPNIAPVTALAFLAAAYLPSRWGWSVPFGLMVASDLAIGGYDPRIMASVYGSFGFSYALGLTLRQRRTVPRLILLSVIASTFFYLVTNAAVWLWAGYYPSTLSGLGLSLAAGLPFFRNTLVGDLLFTGLFFGARELIMVYWRRLLVSDRVPIHG